MNLTTAQQFMVDQYRQFLSMNVMPLSGSAYNNASGSKLADEELWQDFRMGLQMFNASAPFMTVLSTNDLYNASAQASSSGLDPNAPENEDFSSILIQAIEMCALFFTLVRLQVFEAGKHFRFSDNGISIERVKQADYAAIAGGSVIQYITTVLPTLKKTLGMTTLRAIGNFSGLISFPRSLTRGLRGTRLGLGS
jgi:hypothetical protein